MVEQSTGLVTAVNPYIGYQNETSVAQEALKAGRATLDIVLDRKLMEPGLLAAVLRPEILTRPTEMIQFDEMTGARLLLV